MPATDLTAPENRPAITRHEVSANYRSVRLFSATAVIPADNPSDVRVQVSVAVDTRSMAFAYWTKFLGLFHRHLLPSISDDPSAATDRFPCGFGTPVSAYLKLKQSYDWSFLFESVEGSDLGQLSILARAAHSSPKTVFFRSPPKRGIRSMNQTPSQHCA
ncbi:MAG: hypothetical protein R3C68_18625 [Myxococcota bacterium]